MKTSVIGCPKTIDGDLKCKEVPTSFGFDTACKVINMFALVLLFLLFKERSFSPHGFCLLFINYVSLKDFTFFS